MQNGIKLMFRDKFLYDLETFDNKLYERPDLQWIKSSVLLSFADGVGQGFLRTG
jgi:hypothetical protein